MLPIGRFVGTGAFGPLSGAHARIEAERNQRCASAHRIPVKVDMTRLLVVILLAGILHAQTPVPETKDPLGRGTPQDSVFHFLEACHARDYSKALRYLDLRKMSPANRVKEGQELARQLEDLLDDTPFDITMLSRDPDGGHRLGLSRSVAHGFGCGRTQAGDGNRAIGRAPQIVR